MATLTRAAPAGPAAVAGTVGRLRDLVASRVSTRSAVLWGVSLLCIYLVLIPVLALVYGTFFTATASGVPGAGTFTLQNYVDLFSNPRTYELIRNSASYAVGTAIFAVVLALLIAWLIERTDVPGRGLFQVLTMGPLIVPGILFTIAWLLLLAPNVGFLNVLLGDRWGIPASPFSVYSLWGMIWVEGLHSSPLAFLLLAAALRSMDPALEEAARMSGASGLRTAFRVTLPLIRPAVIASLLLMFVRAFSSFEVAALVGLPAKFNVLAARIYLALSNFPADYGAAGTVAILMMAITVVGIAIYSRVLRQRDAYSTITGKNFRPVVMQLGVWRWPAAGFLSLYILLVFILPMFILAWNSVSPYYQVPSVDGLARLTWENYVFVFTFPQAQRAVTNSLLLSVSAATLVMLLTAVVAWLLIRTQIRGRWLLDALVSMPVAFPSLVFGVALIWLYLRLPIQLYGTLWILLIAYTTQFLPYGMRYTSSSMLQIHRELEEAAAVSGGTWLATFGRILVPLLAPGLVAGWLYILLASFRELGSSILLVSAGTEVFSTLIFNMWANGKSVQLAALGMLLTVAFLVLYYVSLALSRRIGLRAEPR